jgi:hypothetical protein
MIQVYFVPFAEPSSTQPSPDFILYFFAIERILEFFSLTRIRNLLNNGKDAKAWV